MGLASPLGDVQLTSWMAVASAIDKQLKSSK